MMNFNAWALNRAIDQERKQMTDDYNLACSENLRYEVNRQRAKDGLQPLPTYTPAADSGERNRRNDAKVSDPVNQPAHYTGHPSGVECITITEHMGFNLGNALKYIWRCDLKADALEDLRKAEFYIKREIAKREKAAA